MYKIVDIVKKESGRVDYYVLEDKKGNKKGFKKDDVVDLIEKNQVSNATIHYQQSQKNFYNPKGYPVIYVNKEKTKNINTVDSGVSQEKNQVTNYYLGLRDFYGDYYKIDLLNRKVSESSRNQILELFEKNETVGVNVKNGKLSLSRCAFLNDKYLVILGSGITNNMYNYPIKDVRAFRNYTHNSLMFNQDSPWYLSLCYLNKDKVVTVSPLYNWDNFEDYIKTRELKLSDFSFDSNDESINFKVEETVLDADYMSDMDYPFNNPEDCSIKYDIDCSIFVNREGEIVLREKNPTVYGFSERSNDILLKKNVSESRITIEDIENLEKDPVWFTWSKYGGAFTFYKRKDGEKKIIQEFLMKEVEVKKEKEIKEQKEKKIKKEMESNKYQKPLENEKFLIGYDYNYSRDYYKIGFTSHILAKTTPTEIKRLIKNKKAAGVEIINNELKMGYFVFDFSEKYLFYCPLMGSALPSLYYEGQAISNRNSIDTYLLFHEKSLYKIKSKEVRNPFAIYILSISGNYVKSALPFVFVDNDYNSHYYKSSKYNSNTHIEKGNWYCSADYIYFGLREKGNKIQYYRSIEEIKTSKWVAMYKEYEYNEKVIAEMTLGEINKKLKNNGAWFTKNIENEKK